MLATMAHVLILSIIFGVCCTLAEKSDNTTTNENSKNLSNSEDKFLANAIRGKNLSELALDNIDDEGTKKTDKKPRTVLHRDSSLERGSSCCSSKYSSSGFARPDYNYNRISSETGRYSSHNERQPIDRYGWQTQGRPPGSIGNGDRPGGGSGSGVYAGSQLGDRYGPRPASETANRPITLGYGSGNGGGYGYVVNGYGGYGRPTGHGGSISTYGISGTLADGDEFGPNDASYPDASTPQGNIQAQKAIALKALAGVALIGAAAALASNPVLLPIGFVSGRRKRSETFTEDEQANFQMDYILYMLRENLAKIQKDSNSKLVISPRCVARLTCEIQKDYLSDIGKDVEILNTNRRYYLTNLIRNNVLNTSTVSTSIKDLIKLAVGVASKNESCDVFTCNYIRKV
ncbi:PREDICTED: uncharacterized protein LOC108756086 [Trachymyrmex septentrionalis]|uniref:uncharacterized protein LOC108756086 n=1 Tax=Trachymyrmex septentrionalis TaxID=34720 RepID=UPI00084F80E9|nr:PREDICTED: uncharacterized protein LOC108756086 [Trachymyrmex septentrionalis]